MNRLNVLPILCVVLAVSVIGCDTKNPIAADAKKAAQANVPAKTQSQKADASDPKKSDSSSVPSASTLSISDLPATLKNEAFDYFGLGGKSIGLQFKNPMTGVISTGSSSASLMKISSGSATFTINRTGQLGDLLGNDTVELTPDGVYDVSTTMGKLQSRVLELPNDLNPGKTWNYDVNMVTASGKVSQKFVQKVIGVQTLKTPAGTMNVLYVEGHGTESINGQTSKADTKSYFAKGLGLIQFEESLTGKNGKLESVTIKLLPNGN